LPLEVCSKMFKASVFAGSGWASHKNGRTPHTASSHHLIAETQSSSVSQCTTWSRATTSGLKAMQYPHGWFNFGDHFWGVSPSKSDGVLCHMPYGWDPSPSAWRTIPRIVVNNIYLITLYIGSPIEWRRIR
jgi:hypothetical protein